MGMTPRQRKIRKPGQAPDLSSEEIRDTMDPAMIAAMSNDQRVLRRGLRQEKAKLERRARRRESIRQGYGVPEKKKCNAFNAAGTRCKSWAMFGEDVCLSHADAETKARKSPRIPTRKAPEVMRDAVEVAVAKILAPYFKSLGLELVGYDAETNEPVVQEIAGGGIMLHGESKDGDINMTNYPNMTAQVAVAEKLLDRVYGKPRQTTVLEGGITPIRVEPVRSEERAQAVADLLQRSGALPDASHEGRKRRAPAKPTDAVSISAAPTNDGEDA